MSILLIKENIINTISLTEILKTLIVPISLVLFVYGLEINQIINYFDLTLYSKLLTILLILVFFYLVYYSINLISKNFLTSEIIKIISIILIFIPFSLLGPFLLPPSDPVYHLFVLIDSLYANEYNNTTNRALVNKELFELIYYIFSNGNWNYKILYSIYSFHIFSNIILLLATYMSSRLYGLSYKWSIVSVLIMILFYGTNRFNYFTYYSLAPSSINMSFFWLISALLISLSIKPKKITLKVLKKIFFISFLGICLLPVIYYNHHQEGGFIFFLYLLIFTILSIRLIYQMNLKSHYKKVVYSIFFLILFAPTNFIINNFVIPQSEIYLRINEATIHLSHFNSYWIFGNLLGPRIWDTFSFYAYISLLFVLMHLLYAIIYNKKINNHLVLAMIPGLLSFWVILIPFNIMIWIQSVKSNPNVWRMAYLSQYWFSIAYIISKVDHYIFTSKKND